MIITSEDMAERVRSGTALPLLPEGIPGPVQHAGQWWAIPTGASDYRRVTDPTVVDRLNYQVERYARARTAATQARDGESRP